MKKIILLCLCLLVCGCSKIPRRTNDEIRRKHVVLKVLVDRISNQDNTRKPTKEELEDTVKLCLKDYESLDRLLNNWKPTIEMPEVDMEGK